MHCLRTNSENSDFHTLAGELDTFLRIHDGKDHAFYSQFNKIDSLKFVVLAYDGEVPVGCGAFKVLSPETVEVKRMYVVPSYRNKGVASLLLKTLENWARESGYTQCVLETGIRLTEAIQLYRKNGYRKIPNYGQYEQVETSECFGKSL